MAELRRQFPLPGEDQAFVEGLGLPWETIQEGRSLWLILHDYQVASGFNVEQVSVGLLLPANYPTAQIDMAYFYPHLSLTNGRPIPKLTDHQLDGRAWQRWSRHRTAGNAWRPEIDGVGTHLVLVDAWLEREAGR